MAKSKPSRRGGARKGAGRPKIDDPRTTIHAGISSATAALLDACMTAWGCSQGQVLDRWARRPDDAA